MAGKIIWTLKAKNQLIDIFNYWNNRNKSNTFSIKLNKLIEQQLNLILLFPKIGRKTDIPNVYVKIVHKYLVYYECIDDNIYVLSVRHCSRNTETFNI